MNLIDDMTDYGEFLPRHLADEAYIRVTSNRLNFAEAIACLSYMKILVNDPLANMTIHDVMKEVGIYANQQTLRLDTNSSDANVVTGNYEQTKERGGVLNDWEAS